MTYLIRSSEGNKSPTLAFLRRKGAPIRALCIIDECPPFHLCGFSLDLSGKRREGGGASCSFYPIEGIWRPSAPSCPVNGRGRVPSDDLEFSAIAPLKCIYVNVSGIYLPIVSLYPLTLLTFLNFEIYIYIYISI